MNSKISKEEQYLRAKKRVDELKGFYIHLGVYIAVNIFLSARQVYGDMQDGFTFTEAIFDLSTYWVWIFWGIGMFLHAFRVFGSHLILGKDWEEKKINEFMNEDKNK